VFGKQLYIFVEKEETEIISRGEPEIAKFMRLSLFMLRCTM